MIILTDIDAQVSAAALTEKICARLVASYASAGRVIEVTTSIGVALYRVDGQNCSDLVKQADIAMYLAKVAQQPANPILSAGQGGLAFS